MEGQFIMDESLGKVRPACLSLCLDMPVLEER